MRPIPELVRTMLKSKSMTGSEGKPTNLVTIAGSGGWEQQETPARIMQGLGATPIPVSNWVKKTDGGYMCCWVDVTTLKLQTGFSANLDFLTTNYAIDSVIVTDSIVAFTAGDRHHQCVLYKRSDNKVLLIMLTGRGANCYISNTGNGDDWTFYSTVYNLGGTGQGGGYLFPGLVTPTGRLIFSGAMPSADFGAYYDKLSCIYTDDGGLTWGYIPISSWYAMEAAAQLCCLKDGTLFASFARGTGACPIYKSIDDGITWTEVANFVSGFSDKNYNNIYGLSFYYDALLDTAYAVKTGVGNFVIFKNEHPTQTTFIDKTAWIEVFDPNWGSNNSHGAQIYVLENHLIFVNPYWWWLAGWTSKDIKIPVKSIAISRNKNTAGQLTLGVDNKDGEWAPDGDINPNVLWLNKQIGVQQGYGSSLVKTFTGTIDSVDMSSFPQEITVNLRDHLKYALDQTITFPGVTWDLHSITYQWQTIEAIVTDLVSKAWMTAGEIHATGIVLQEQSFSWCKYADAFQELADLAGGYEFGCDEDGLFFFRKDSNVSPLAKGWILTFTDGAAQTLYYPIVAESDKIFDGDGVKYTRDVDYTIDYLTGAIASINIPDGATTMDYAYVSYEFVEGKDIVKLSYSLNDDAAYRKVAVYGQASTSKVAEGWTITFKDGKAKTGQLPASGTDKIYTSSHTYIRGTDYTINYLTGDITSLTIADGSYKMDYDYTDPNGPVVFGATDFPSRDYYNILPQKYLRINAGQSAKTSAECKAIADQTVYLMESRIRVCTFSSIGIPWLQIGDFIRVKETSTSISEIYRITDITTNMDDEGYTMDITCYHHSA